jgi:hypothetical protein
MRSSHFISLFALTLASTSSSAWAFLDPPYVTPEHPVQGQQVSVNIHGGVCDAIVGLPGYPQITAQGNDIHILLFSVHYDDPEFCNLGTGTATIPFGPYSSGSYILVVERQYMTISGTWARETLGTIPFTVGGAPPQPPIEAPTLRVAGLGALLLALIAIALLNLRTRAA